jgi:LAO/AO transport system kinase
VRSSTSSRSLPLSTDPRALADRLLSRERDAVAEALNLADDRRPDRQLAALALLDRLETESPFPGAARIGITGAPGAGKSTLLDALVREVRGRGETVAIVAVDPSSQRTGGALLGDRIRVRSGASDPGVFIRSMAARDRLGGLSDAAHAGVTILTAVFDRVFVETVGVGQSEADVSRLVDTLVFVANPGTGDVLQFMKAGLLELPHVFVVNKADAGPIAQRTASELESGLGLGERGDADWTPPVLLTSARDGVGIGALVDALDAHRRHLLEDDRIARRRAEAARALVLGALERRYGSYGLQQLGGPAALRARLADDPGTSAFTRIARLGAEIEEALHKGG